MRYFSDDKTRNVKVFEKNYFNLSFQAQSTKRDDIQQSRKSAKNVINDDNFWTGPLTGKNNDDCQMKFFEKC